MSLGELAERLNSFASKEFGRGASESEIDAASTRLGVAISGGYRQFLRRFGWGGVGHIELFGLGADVLPYLNLIAMTESERSVMHPPIPPFLLPVMNDGSGNHYCLDTRVPAEPPVVFWNHELGVDQVPERVAPDFASWLSQLIDRLEQG